MNRDDDAEILAAARAGFLDEASDMLAQFEQALLVMETTPEDAENLNAAFRAAHTIKGTAGMFGCEAVVTFTHEVETLLEHLRSGALATDTLKLRLLRKGGPRRSGWIPARPAGNCAPATPSSRRTSDAEGLPPNR